MKIVSTTLTNFFFAVDEDRVQKKYFADSVDYWTIVRFCLYKNLILFALPFLLSKNHTLNRSNTNNSAVP